MMEKGHILLKKAQIDEKRNNNIFWIFSWKYGKLCKRVKNDEKGSDVAEKGPNWWKMRKNIFFGFIHENMEKQRKKVKNDEKRSDFAEKGPNWWKMKKKIFFRFVHENMEKQRKKWKMMKKGQMLLKKAQIDEKWEK